MLKSKPSQLFDLSATTPVAAKPVLAFSVLLSALLLR